MIELLSSAFNLRATSPTCLMRRAGLMLAAGWSGLFREALLLLLLISGS
jgi:hypothetical protein